MPSPAEIEVDEWPAPKGIVFALGALGETRQAIRLTQRANPVAASGQNLVRIGLMTHIPDQTVVRRVEQVVQGDRQLDDAQARAKMSASHRNGVNHFVAQFVGNLT